MGPKFETGRLTKRFIDQIKARDELRRQNETVLDDNAFQQLFYAELAGLESSKMQTKSYVINNYFTKNFGKYVKRSPEDNDPNRIFLPDEDSNEKLKVPFLPEQLDCFLTRYIYHNFARWTNRLFLYMGLTSE